LSNAAFRASRALDNASRSTTHCPPYPEPNQGHRQKTPPRDQLNQSSASYFVSEPWREIVDAGEFGGCARQMFNPENMTRLGSYFCRTVVSCDRFEPK
jgi:hypothetical protein